MTIHVSRFRVFQPFIIITSHGPRGVGRWGVSAPHTLHAAAYSRMVAMTRKAAMTKPTIGRRR